MNEHEEKQLIEIVSALCDEIATPEQITYLRTLLRENPEARRAYLNLMDLNFELADEFSLASPAPREILAAPTPRRNWPVFAAAAAAIVAAGLLLWLRVGNDDNTGANRGLTGTEIPAETVASTAIGHVLTIQNGVALAEGSGARAIAIGEQIVLGDAPLAMEIGSTRVIAQGPAMLTVNGPDEITLDGGRMVAVSGAGESGFAVQTPNCRVTDLGTAFAIEAGPAGTSTLVLHGTVEVAYGEEVHTLLPGGHLFVGSNPEDTTVNEGDLRPYRNLLELAAGGIITDGGVTALPMAAGFLSDTIRIWPERQDYALETPLPATFSAPGTYTSAKHVGGQIPKNTRVDSYMIFFRPINRRNRTQQIGTVRFPRPIIGVICNDAALTKSDPYFSGPPRPDTALSSVFAGPKDVITVSPDGMSLELNLSSTAAFSCEIRVLIKAE